MTASAVAIRTSLVLRRQRELVDRFLSAGATSPERAIPRGDLGTLSGPLFARLARHGVLVAVAENRWYLEKRTWDRFRLRQRRRSLALAIVVVLIVAGLLAIWFAR